MFRFRQAMILPQTSLLQRNRRRCIHASGAALNVISKVAEDKIAAWRRERDGEAESSGSAYFGRRLPADRHEGLARTLGVHRDYVHSKILADNNVRPESVERRLELDAAWDELRRKIRLAYAASGAAIDAFVASKETRDEFGVEMDRLEAMAKGVNDAILSDTLRFNGRCPVRHARGFDFGARVREAIAEGGALPLTSS